MWLAGPLLFGCTPALTSAPQPLDGPFWGDPRVSSAPASGFRRLAAPADDLVQGLTPRYAPIPELNWFLSGPSPAALAAFLPEPLSVHNSTASPVDVRVNAVPIGELSPGATGTLMGVPAGGYDVSLAPISASASLTGRALRWNTTLWTQRGR